MPELFTYLALLRKSGGINREKADELVLSVQRNRDQTIEFFGELLGVRWILPIHRAIRKGSLTLRLSLRHDK